METVLPKAAVLKLTLPEDPVRQAQLRKKLDEYQFRLKVPLYDYVQTTYKIDVLQKLFDEGVIEPAALAAELSAIPAKHFDIGAFYNAITVIENYCRTGGAFAIGGTGLPKVS
jgi:hypothetical protein